MATACAWPTATAAKANSGRPNRRWRCRATRWSLPGRTTCAWNACVAGNLRDASSDRRFRDGRCPISNWRCKQLAVAAPVGRVALVFLRLVLAGRLAGGLVLVGGVRAGSADRKGVVGGKGVAVSVGLGGCGDIKKK